MIRPSYGGSPVSPLLLLCQGRGRCGGNVSPMGFPSGSYELGSHLPTGPSWLGSHWYVLQLGLLETFWGPILNHNWSPIGECRLRAFRLG